MMPYPPSTPPPPPIWEAFRKAYEQILKQKEILNSIYFNSFCVIFIT